MWGELPFSLKDFVFKTQGLKNSSSFLAVPPLPPMLLKTIINIRYEENKDYIIFKKGLVFGG